jgi:hypothetical protein
MPVPRIISTAINRTSFVTGLRDVSQICATHSPPGVYAQCDARREGWLGHGVIRPEVLGTAPEAGLPESLEAFGWELKDNR